MKPFHMARKILLPAVLLALAIGLAWKQTELAASLPADRVEILADGGASYLFLRVRRWNRPVQTGKPL